MTVATDLVLVTSIAPVLHRSSREIGHAYQARCVQSWLNAGAVVVSLNAESEIAGLRASHPDVVFVRSETAGKINPRRPVPALQEMVEVGRQTSDTAILGVTNSDIEFLGDSEHLAALAGAVDGGMITMHRAERRLDGAIPGLPYLYGYDVFLFDREAVPASTLDGFAIGAPWWDYMLMFAVAAAGAPIRTLHCPIVSHLTHDQKWDYDSWGLGLDLVVRKLRTIAEAEGGAAAALFRYLCLNLDSSMAPGYAAQDLRAPLGTVLGMAMVDFVRSRGVEVLEFDGRLRDGHLEFDHELHRFSYVDSLRSVPLRQASR